MQYVDCKYYAQEILDAVKATPNKGKLVILTVGDDPASASYVKGKIKDCEYCGIPYEHIKAQTKLELGQLIFKYKDDTSVGGIIIQLPLPDGWDEDSFTNLVPPHLDVDGFVSDSHFKPCTPEGILYVLEKEVGDLAGKTVLLIGKGKLVGKPLIDLLLERGCTLTIAHSRTDKGDFRDLLWDYHDIVITAVGKPKLVNLFETTADVVIDAGISRDEDGMLCGDCYGFHRFAGRMRVTTVPGGIGLMTRAMLMAHVARLKVE